MASLTDAQVLALNRVLPKEKSNKGKKALNNEWKAANYDWPALRAICELNKIGADKVKTAIEQEDPADRVTELRGLLVDGKFGAPPTSWFEAEESALDRVRRMETSGDSKEEVSEEEKGKEGKGSGSKRKQDEVKLDWKVCGRCATKRAEGADYCTQCSWPAGTESDQPPKRHKGDNGGSSAHNEFAVPFAAPVEGKSADDIVLKLLFAEGLFLFTPKEFGVSKPGGIKSLQLNRGLLVMGEPVDKQFLPSLAAWMGSFDVYAEKIGAKHARMRPLLARHKLHILLRAHQGWDWSILARLDYSLRQLYAEKPAELQDWALDLRLDNDHRYQNDQLQRQRQQEVGSRASKPGAGKRRNRAAGRGKGTAAAGSELGPCWQFQQQGSCKYGDECKFNHDAPTSSNNGGGSATPQPKKSGGRGGQSKTA
jgi:hypothetical protein